MKTQAEKNIEFRKKRTKAHAEFRATGDTKPLERIGLKPVPEALKGKPFGGKAGRPRSGRSGLDIIDDPKTGAVEYVTGMDEAYNRFLDGIDQDELKQALAISAPGPRQKFSAALQFLTDPKLSVKRGKIQGLSILMKKSGITLPELMDMYGRYRTSQAIRIAMDRAPKIIMHTADDAENKQVNCPRCDGFGTLDLDKGDDDKRKLSTIRTCPECEGRGRVTQSGDNEARKLVLEVAGIAGKKGPMVDARSVHYGNGVFSVESLVRDMEKPDDPVGLIESGDIIEAEVENV